MSQMRRIKFQRSILKGKWMAIYKPDELRKEQRIIMLNALYGGFTIGKY